MPYIRRHIVVVFFVLTCLFSWGTWFWVNGTHRELSRWIGLVAVNPSHTSQLCSGCGRIVPQGLAVRVHECPACGLVLDRDVNAARNILFLALTNPPGGAGQALTWAVAPGVA